MKETDKQYKSDKNQWVLTNVKYSLSMESRISTNYPHGFIITLKFQEGYWVQRSTPKEGYNGWNIVRLIPKMCMLVQISRYIIRQIPEDRLSVQWLKYCEYNNQGEHADPNGKTS